MSANRFRFRIWDVEAAQYYSEESLAALGLCLLPTGRVGFYSFDSLRESGIDYVVEMSTGLLDKNGIEIFEGDVIRYLVGHGGRQSIVCDVAWSDFKHGWLPFCDDAYRINNGEVSEILGSIHANPELLK